MKHRAWVIGLLLLLSGCTFSRVIAYCRPGGAGEIAVDDRQMPRTMEYGFGTGSVLAVSTERKRRKTEINFTLRLRDTARFASDSGHILFVCDGRTAALPAPAWHEQRIKEGAAYDVEHAWGDVLDASNAPAVANKAVRGDYSTGEFRASMTLSQCKDLPFSFTWPTVRIGETVHEFGRVSMTPQMMPLTWTLPVPTRVEGSPGDP
jgi:hypothetical protein